VLSPPPEPRCDPKIIRSARVSPSSVRAAKRFGPQTVPARSRLENRRCEKGARGASHFSSSSSSQVENVRAAEVDRARRTLRERSSSGWEPGRRPAVLGLRGDEHGQQMLQVQIVRVQQRQRHRPLVLVAQLFCRPVSCCCCCGLGVDCGSGRAAPIALRPRVSARTKFQNSLVRRASELRTGLPLLRFCFGSPRPPRRLRCLRSHLPVVLYSRVFAHCSHRTGKTCPNWERGTEVRVSDGAFRSLSLCCFSLS